MRLLEREGLLAALEADRRVGGRMVLVAGEAGVGKTALVDAFTAAAGSLRVLRGACDPLETPRPLGPLFDLAYETGGDLLDSLLANAPREVVFRTAFDELRTADTIVVLEDAHWADGGTLDWLRFAGRRIRQTEATVVVTYRPGESGALQRLLGQLTTAPGVVRLDVAPLSPEAVSELAAEVGHDGVRVYAATGGNAFFVTELLASDNELPTTVRDAVLARAATLSEPARATLDAASVLGTTFDEELLRAVEPKAVEGLDQCLATGILQRGDGDSSLSFRHDLARRAVEAALGGPRAAALHGAALDALPDDTWDTEVLSMRVEHADRAGRHAELLPLAVAASDRASALGAHGEAAAYLRRAIPLARGDELSRLLFEHMREAGLVDDFDAVEWGAERARREAIRNGDRMLESAACHARARVAWRLGEHERSVALAGRAVELAEPYGASPELARAYAMQTASFMFLARAEDCERSAAHAIEIAEAVSDFDSLADATGYLGVLRAWRGDGLELVRRAVDIAREHRRELVLGRWLNNLAATAAADRRFDVALPAIEECRRFAEARDLDSILTEIEATHAEALLRLGLWNEAAAAGERLLALDSPALSVEVNGLVAKGLVAARRGDAVGHDLIAQALDRVGDSDELQHAFYVRFAAAECAWLRGLDPAALEHGRWGLVRMPESAPNPWLLGTAAFWADALPAESRRLAEPYALVAEGRIGEAAAALDRLGCAYDAALVRTRCGNEEDVRAAFRAFRELGADAASDRAAQRLRELGARGIPRRPRAATAANPAGLTSRELDVLRLLGRGLQNREIAAELVLSPRTVETHVARILRKLGVRTRAAAARKAVELGLVEQR
jgi:DNA-binding CsgD family transcriptional regulator